jgi:hypothetical protein
MSWFDLLLSRESDDSPTNNIENSKGCNLPWRPQLDRFRVGRTDLFTCLVEISIINTHPPIFILFRYRYGIGEPIWVVHFFDKTSI